MSRWRKPTRDEIRAKRAEVAARARAGQLKLPDAIVDMRRSLGLSQEEFAKLFRLTRRHLAEIERGEANPTMETLDRIGKAFGFRVGFVPIADRMPAASPPAGEETQDEPDADGPVRPRR